MIIILKHIFRNIRKNLFSGILIIMSLMLTAAAVYLNMNINDDVISISHKMFESFFGGYDISVSAGETGRLESAMLADSGDVLPVSYRGGKCPDEWEAAAIIISTDLPTAQERSLISIASGSLPTGGDFVCVTELKAARYDLSVGDVIAVTEEDGDGNETVHEYTVCAVCDTIGMFTDERHEYVELLRPIGDEAADTVLINTDRSVEDETYRLKCEYPELDVQMLVGSVNTEEYVTSIRSILYMVLAMSMVMSYYIVSSVTTLMLDSRMPVIGTFRSIGVGSGKMNLLLLVENAFYGIFGGAFGIGIGEILRYLLAAVYYNTAGADRSIRPVYVVIAVAFTLGLQIVITSFSLIRAGKHSIREIIFHTSAVAAEFSPARAIAGAVMLAVGAVLHIFNHNYGFYRNIAAAVLIVVGSALMIPLILTIITKIFARGAMENGHGPLYLAFRDLSASRINISSVILTAMVIALSLVILMCETSVSAFFDSYKHNYPYDVFIKGLSLDVDEYDFINEIEGVRYTVAERWDYGRAEVDGNETGICYVCRGGYSNGISADEDMLAELEDGHVIVDELFAIRCGIDVGDTVSFADPEGEAKTFTAVIDGLCDSGVFNSKRTCVIMTEADFAEYVEISPALIGVYVSERYDQSDVISKLSLYIFAVTGENASVHSKDSYLSRELENTYDALAIFSVVPMLAAVLAVMGLVNNQIISYNRKRREYAVLYSVAMSKRQLSRLVIYELVLVFLAGTLCGTLIAVWLTAVVRDILFGLIAYVKITIDAGKLAAVLAGAFAILCISGLLPGRMVSKMNVIEEIQYD